MHALRGQWIHAETGIAKPNIVVPDGILGVMTGGIARLWIGALPPQLLQLEGAELPKQAGVLCLYVVLPARSEAARITEDRDDSAIARGLGIPKPGVIPGLDQPVELGHRPERPIRMD